MNYFSNDTYAYSRYNQGDQLKAIKGIMNIMANKMKKAEYPEHIICATEIAFLHTIKFKYEKEIMKRYEGGDFVGLKTNRNLVEKLFSIGFQFYDLMLELIQEHGRVFKKAVDYLFKEFNSNRISTGALTGRDLKGFTWAEICNTDMARFFTDALSELQRGQTSFFEAAKSYTVNPNNQTVTSPLSRAVGNAVTPTNFKPIKIENPYLKRVLPGIERSGGIIVNFQQDPNTHAYRDFFGQGPSGEKLSANFIQSYYGMISLLTGDTFWNQYNTENIIDLAQNENQAAVVSAITSLTRGNILNDQEFDKYFENILPLLILIPSKYLNLYVQNTDYNSIGVDISTAKRAFSTITKVEDAFENYFEKYIPFSVDYIADLTSSGSNDNIFKQSSTARDELRYGITGAEIFQEVMRDIENDKSYRFNNTLLFGGETDLGRTVKRVLLDKINQCRKVENDSLRALGKVDKRAAKSYRRDYFYNEVSDYSAKPYYYSSLDSLIDMLKDKQSLIAKFKIDDNTDDSSEYLLNSSSNIKGFYKEEIKRYYEYLNSYLKNTIENFEGFSKYLRDYDKNYKNNTLNEKSERMRNVKIDYGKTVISFFKKLISNKYVIENKLMEMFKILKTNVDVGKFYEAYDNYIKSVKNTDSLTDLTAVVKYSNLIGKDIEYWSDFDVKSLENKSGSLRSNLKNLNAMIAEMFKPLRKQPGYNGLLQKFKNLIHRKAARDLMTLNVLKHIIQPMTDIFNFNFTSENSISKEKLQFDFKLEKAGEKSVNEILIEFIKKYLSMNLGYKTSRGQIFLRHDFFMNMRDKVLEPEVAKLLKIIDEYENFIKKIKEQIIESKPEEKSDEESTQATEEDSEEEEIEPPVKKEVPEKEIVEKLNAEGYVSPLMFHNNASMTSCKCEYQLLPNNQGIQIKLLNCPDVSSRPIIAIPIVNDSVLASVNLNNGNGVINNLSINGNTRIDFYYENLDPNKFIGSTRLHNIKDLKDAKTLNVNYVEKNLDTDNEKTVLNDYGDKIIVQLPKSFYTENVVFVTCNESNRPDPDKYKHNIVCTKDGKSLLIIDDASLLASLGKQFELHMYNNILKSENYVTKLIINRDSIKGKNDEQGNEDKSTLQNEKESADEIENNEENKTKASKLKNGKKSKKKKNKVKKESKDVEEDESVEKENAEKQDESSKPNYLPKLDLMSFDDDYDLDSTDDEDDYLDSYDY